MKFILLPCLTVLAILSCDQTKRGQIANIEKKSANPIDSLQFTEYRDFEKAFKRNPDLKQLASDYDFKWILLLDSSFSKTIYRFAPQLREEVYFASLACKPNKHTVGFRTELQTLKSVLLDHDARGMVHQCTHSGKDGGSQDKIASPIYINRNSAILEIENEISRACYYITLFDGTVQLNLLEVIIE